MEEEIKTEQVKAHDTIMSIVKATPAEVDAGTDITLKVKVSCLEKCNLQGGKLIIIDDEDSVRKELELLESDESDDETDEFTVKVPNKSGSYTWTAEFPSQEKEGVLHGGSSTRFSFIVKPHKTSMVVLNVPNLIVVNTKFRCRVGVKCSVDCKLTGKEIEIYDHEGAKVGTGVLGDAPWMNTSALYWGEVELEAPVIEGCYKCEVRFPTLDLELSHEEVTDAFVFKTVKQPDHVVTVEVIDKDKRAPIKNADVLLMLNRDYPYKNRTDDCGLAKIGVPKGEYQLYVTKYDYETFRTKVNVTSDVDVQAELLFAPRVEILF